MSNTKNPFTNQANKRTSNFNGKWPTDEDRSCAWWRLIFRNSKQWPQCSVLKTKSKTKADSRAVTGDFHFRSLRGLYIGNSTDVNITPAIVELPTLSIGLPITAVTQQWQSKGVHEV